MKPDLGIAGMAVAATTKQPNRSGVLVTGIVGDSVADKAGIIVGDILYEFDGRPVSTLSDLATAIAASRAQFDRGDQGASGHRRHDGDRSILKSGDLQSWSKS